MEWKRNARIESSSGMRVVYKRTSGQSVVKREDEKDLGLGVRCLICSKRVPASETSLVSLLVGKLVRADIRAINERVLEDLRIIKIEHMSRGVQRASGNGYRVAGMPGFDYTICFDCFVKAAIGAGVAEGDPDSFWLKINRGVAHVDLLGEINYAAPSGQHL